MVSLNGKVYYTDAVGMADALPELETGRTYEVRAAKTVITLSWDL